MGSFLEKIANSDLVPIWLAVILFFLVLGFAIQHPLNFLVLVIVGGVFFGAFGIAWVVRELARIILGTRRWE